MALNEARDWIIAYDIADPRRLVRVHRLMVKRAIPQQRSVFRAAMTPLQARALKGEVEALIDRTEDDVRFYPLPATPEILRVGRQDLESTGVFVA